MINGRVSFWHHTLGGITRTRPSFPGDLDVDVAIIGGGFTGLWTAYYLKAAAPDLDVVVLEAEACGFGASGRNGGYLSAGLYWPTPRNTEQKQATARLYQTMHATVSEVIRVMEAEGLEADAVPGGSLQVATNAAQWYRMRKHAGSLQVLSAAEVTERVRVAGAVGATYDPITVRLHPAKLVRSLAAAVERKGVKIYEGTRVLKYEPTQVWTNRGAVTAKSIIRATEGYTSGIRGYKRLLLPMNSAMIATEPLPEEAWAEIGWSGMELIGEGSHAVVYSQRTSDGRIALGGRGVPYRFGSRTDVNGQTQHKTIESLRSTLHRLFPLTRPYKIDHAWCGVLGVPRDWAASVGYDQVTGLGWGGGYVGTGVGAANLAGRTLSDLILGHQSDLTTLPWVNHRSRSWEPEPLRWLGVRGMYKLYELADRHESSGRVSTSPFARMGDLITGKPR